VNQEEKIAERFLIDQGYKSIEFEPLGNSKPPDFLINGDIAIEVRRLNKHVNTTDKIEPIENLEFEFVPKFKNLLRELEQPDLPYSIGVTLQYRRPLKMSKQLLTELKKSITVTSQSKRFGVDVKFNDQITYILFKANGRSDQTYKLIIESDLDKGGIIQDARYDALKISIPEKIEKLKNIRNLYSEFWLILIDDIFSRVDESTKWDLQRYPKIESDFSRIIMISKSDPSQWVDITKGDKK